MPVHDLSEGRNCQVADKLIGTTFTIDTLQPRLLTTSSLYQKRLMHMLIQLQSSNWLTKKN